MYIQKILIYIFTIVLMFSSCKEEDQASMVEPAQGSPSLFLSVDQSFIPDFHTGYIWITDHLNEIIVFDEVQNSQSIEFDLSDAVNKDEISLHIFIENEFNSSLSTYSNINLDSIELKKGPYQFGGISGTAELYRSNFLPNHNQWFISHGSRDYDGNFEFGNNTRFSINTFEGIEDGYIYIKDEQLGLFGKIENIRPDTEVDLSRVVFNNNMTEHTINAPGGNLIERLEIHGFEEDADFYGKYAIIFDRFTLFDEHPIRLHIPNEVFTRFKTETTIESPNDPSKYFLEHAYGQIPSDFTYINGDINTENININYRNISTQGIFDALSIFVLSSTTSWTFYGENESELEYPSIPQQILNQYPNLEIDHFFNSAFFHRSAILDYGHVNSYQGFVDRSIGHSSPGLLDGITYIRECRINDSF